MITAPAYFGIHHKKVIPPAPVSNDGKFTYTLSSPAKTSAGVYKTNGVMVRTLWSLQDKPSGTHTAYWDGTDDLGNTISSPDANYTVNVTTSNTTYNWDGTIGNTSREQVGENKHHGYYRCAKAMAIAGNFCYFANGYPEGGPSVAKFALNDPQYRIGIWANNINTGDQNHMCTDGNYVYWAGFDPNVPDSSTFVIATRTDTDAEVTFQNGVRFESKNGRDWPSAIAVTVAVPGSEITGIAVQKTGSFLFVARRRNNVINVYNKTTGLLMNTLSYPEPRYICIAPGDQSLWMVTATSSVTKHTINPDGTLSTPTASVVGSDEPCFLQVTPSGSQLAVVNAGLTHQVKFYNTSTGAFVTSLGTAGGYGPDPLVTNYKFFFNDIRISQVRYPTASIVFLPDGSFWLADPGNYRILKFSSALVYQDTVGWLGSSYRTFVDKHNITRVFSDYLEFQIDYSQPLTGTTGWRLHKNWGFGILRQIDVDLPGTKYEYGFINPTTFPNGRTYGFLRIHPTNSRQLVEFPASGPLRLSNIFRFNTGSTIMSDYGIQFFTKGFEPIEAGSSDALFSTLKTYPHTGYDVNGWPTWSTTANSTTTFPPANRMDPNDYPGDDMVTTSNKVIMYNSDAYGRDNVSNLQYGYHLGALNKGGTSFLWRTQRGTHLNYRGPYPGVDRFDVGNGVNAYAGGQHTLLGRHIFTSYHGEFWKNLQTNYFHHFWDNGLAVGLFGTDREVIGGTRVRAFEEMAGNALTPIVVESNTDPTKGFIYHGDEADHSALHRWSMAGLNTVTELTQSIPFPSAYVAPIKNYIDVMAGIPFDSDMPHGTAGWNRNPNPFPITADFFMRSNYTVYDERAPRDIRFNWTDTVKTTGTGYFVDKALGSNTVAGSWELEGKLGFTGADGGGPYINIFLEILDATGKTISSLHYKNQYNDPTFGIANRIIGGTNVILDEGPASDFRNKVRYPVPVKIIMNNGVLVIQFADKPSKVVPMSDLTANWRTPTTFRMRFTRDPVGPGPNKSMIIQDFRLYKDRI